VNTGAVVTWLGWACYAGAAAAIIAYVVHFAGRQGWKRPWNAAGLFFTSIALSQVPFLFEGAIYGRGLRTAVIVTVCLLAATGLQAFIALRRRRRREDAPPADAPASTTPEGPSA
jgi:hypothetical protein